MSIKSNKMTSDEKCIYFREGLGHHFPQLKKCFPEHVENVTISGSHISVIDSIDKFPKLKRLEVVGTQMRHVPVLDLPEATDLVLKNNRIQTISPPHDARKVTHINLEGNILKEIPDLTAFSELMSLHVADNIIEELDLSKVPRSLAFLDGSENYISVVSNGKNAQNLKNLRLNRNFISSLSGINEIPNLDILVAESNKIDRADLREGSKISHLDLSKNKIEHLEIKHGERLDYLYVSENPIKRIGLLNCPNLRYLNISDIRFGQFDHPMYDNAGRKPSRSALHDYADEKYTKYAHQRFEALLSNGWSDKLYNLKILHAQNVYFEPTAIEGFKKMINLTTLKRLGVRYGTDFYEMFDNIKF